MLRWLGRNLLNLSTSRALRELCLDDSQLNLEDFNVRLLPAVEKESVDSVPFSSEAVDEFDVVPTRVGDKFRLALP